MRYEIREWGTSDDDVIESSATLDHARTRLKSLSAKPDCLSWLMAMSFDNGKRVVRSFACGGRLFWSKACKECAGSGRKTKYEKCYQCYGHGAVAGDE